MSNWAMGPPRGPLSDQTNVDRVRPFPMELPIKQELGIRPQSAVVKAEPILPSLHDAVAAASATAADDDDDDEPADVKPKLEDMTGLVTMPGTSLHAHEEPAPEPYTPEGVFKAVQKHISHLNKLILDTTLALPSNRTAEWQAELNKLKDCCGPRTVIAVVGATGAGKSSVINALLDQPDLVPTNCMRACTAVVTEISYHNKPEIEADIEFLKKEDWREELQLLLEDLFDEDGTVRKPADLRSDSAIAYAKFHAVYPSINLDDLDNYSVERLMETGIAAKYLGTTQRVSSSTGKDFSAKVSKWIDSKEKTKKKKKDKDGETEDADDKQEYWPLIERVRIRVNSNTLSTGAVLVDLPGSQDSNAARSAVAKTYMRNADAIWILAPINRAVDDKVAKDLMGDAWRKQALMDGDYNDNVMTFICSKTDDISPREAMRSITSLNDNEELRTIIDELDELEPKLGQSKKDRTSLKRSITRLKSQEEDAKLDRKEWESRLLAKKTGRPFVPQKKGKGKKRKSTGDDGRKRKKRKGNDSDTEDDIEEESSDDDNEEEEESSSDGDLASDSEDDSDKVQDVDMDEENSSDVDGEEDDMTEGELEKAVDEKKSALKGVRGQLANARKDLKQLNKSITKDQNIIKRFHRRKAAICSLARNAYSKDAIKDDFRAGLKELEDAAAQENDPENFDPDEVHRDYDALDLPVFCVSAREYAKLKKLNKADGAPQIFTEMQETEIPNLQQHARNITWAGRDAAAKKSIEVLRNFARTVEVYLGADGQASAQDRNAVREIFKEEANRLSEALDAVVLEKCAGIKKSFKHAVRGKLQEGVHAAEKGAVNTVDDFGYTTHWSTYRATMRRNGVWRRDLNELLIQPVIDEIAFSWKKLFSTGAKDMFADLPERMMVKANERLEAVESRAALSVQDRLHTLREQQQEAMKMRFGHMAETATALIMDLQKDITRQISPDVARQLTDAYDDAGAQAGRGTFMRMKGIMHKYVDENTVTIFTIIAKSTLERMEALGDKAFEAVSAELKIMQRNLRLAYNSLWEDLRVNPEQIQRRGTVRQRAQDVIVAMDELMARAKEAQRQKEFLSGIVGDHQQMNADGAGRALEPYAGPRSLWERFMGQNVAAFSRGGEDF